MALYPFVKRFSHWPQVVLGLAFNWGALLGWVIWHDVPGSNVWAGSAVLIASGLYIAHRETRQLIGAHIIGPQASTLIQQVIQGMTFGQTVDEMARGQYYIHPALPEVVEQALLEL